MLAFIDAHLDDDLSLARLSRVAHASTFHFHHQFSAQFGLGVYRETYSVFHDPSERTAIDLCGETPRDAPLVIRRISLFPDVVEHEVTAPIDRR